MQKQLDLLKDQAPASGSGGETGPVGDRLVKLQQDAGALTNTTENMIQAMEGNVWVSSLCLRKCVRVRSLHVAEL